MSKKVLIEVYGLKDGMLEGNCCSGDCDCDCHCSSPTISLIGDMYNDLVSHFEKSPLKDNVDIRFIDLVNDEFDNFLEISDMLERGFEPPFIAINNEIKLYGTIDKEFIYEYAEDALIN